ncbi:MAG: HDOD domain-containing protein [Candidatus Zixiibacteriota bacterium]
MRIRDKIISTLDSIPSLPTAAIKAVKMLQDPDVSISRLTKTIEYDPALTSNVLRLANSAYFGANRQIESLRQAIVRLGTNNVFRLVVASAVAPLSSQAVKGYDIPPGELWAHSVAVAITSENLRVELNLDAPGYIFTAALLHDLGKIVLGNFGELDVEAILKTAKEREVSFDEAEMAVLGIDHAEVGAVLLEKWNLPKTISEAVRWHHYPKYFPNDPIAIDLIHVGDNLCIKMGIGIGIDGLKHRVSNESVERLKMSNRIAEKVLLKTMGDLNEFRTMFN